MSRQKEQFRKRKIIKLSVDADVPEMKPGIDEPKKVMVRIGNSDYTTFAESQVVTNTPQGMMIAIPEKDAARGVAQLKGRKSKPSRRDPEITREVLRMLAEHPTQSPQWISLELEDAGVKVSEDTVRRIKKSRT